MKGIIVMWSGAIVDIPFGWKLCDGTNGTPDMRNRMIIGAGDTFVPDQIGGYSSHNHTNNHATHAHDLPSGSQVQSGTGYAHTVGTALISTVTGTTWSYPPYYSLAYIMHI
ncbi:MAG: hypothetical protein MUO63_12185 [Desulfobulbaceae bacterium]|nr:hypothetical protein [Desulfobulbaceae bacterium]